MPKIPDDSSETITAKDSAAKSFETKAQEARTPHMAADLSVYYERSKI